MLLLSIDKCYYVQVTPRCFIIKGVMRVPGAMWSRVEPRCLDKLFQIVFLCLGTAEIKKSKQIISMTSKPNYKSSQFNCQHVVCRNYHN